MNRTHEIDRSPYNYGLPELRGTFRGLDVYDMSHPGRNVTCGLWVDEGCSFKDGEYKFYDVTGMFDMEEDPERLRDCLDNSGFDPEPETYYLITFSLVKEDNGCPHFIEYFIVIDVMISAELEEVKDA